MTVFKDIEQKIDQTVELSSVCRGEWCRSLESDMDSLESQFQEYVHSGEVHERFCLADMTGRIRKGYRNLGPVIRI
jgi:hypothetical protein